ncbi:MAG: FecCD family ABC transporter permease [Gemmiger sp.]
MAKKTDGRLPRLALLAGAAVLATALSLCLGAVAVPFSDLLAVLTGQRGTTAAQILLYVRLPRTCGCLLAGAALAVSGAIIQTVLGNPLAAPNIIGVNSGAGLGVALCCALLPVPFAAVPFAAFAGAFLGVMLVLGLAERCGASRMTVVLAGVAISGMFSAAIDAVVTLFPDSLSAYSDFRIGGLSNLSMDKLRPGACVILLCLPAVLLLTHELDLLALGPETAQSLGLPVRRARVGLLALAAALAGAAVSFAGLLGFVGLIVPHIVRRLVGGGSAALLPGCIFGGAALVALCDVAARTLFAPYELPVGVVLSLAGGPFFLWLLFRRRGGRSRD